jgi:hypothetical protein
MGVCVCVVASSPHANYHNKRVKGHHAQRNKEGKAWKYVISFAFLQKKKYISLAYYSLVPRLLTENPSVSEKLEMDAIFANN